MQAGIGKGALLFGVDLREAGFDQFTACADHRGQVRLAGAIAAQAERGFLFGQGDQAVVVTLYGAIQAGVVGQFVFQLLDMLT